MNTENTNDYDKLDEIERGAEEARDPANAQDGTWFQNWGVW